VFSLTWFACNVVCTIEPIIFFSLAYSKNGEGCCFVIRFSLLPGFFETGLKSSSKFCYVICERPDALCIAVFCVVCLLNSGARGDFDTFVLCVEGILSNVVICWRYSFSSATKFTAERHIRVTFVRVNVLLQSITNSVCAMLLDSRYPYSCVLTVCFWSVGSIPDCSINTKTNKATLHRALDFVFIRMYLTVQRDMLKHRSYSSFFSGALYCVFVDV